MRACCGSGNHGASFEGHFKHVEHLVQVGFGVAYHTVVYLTEDLHFAYAYVFYLVHGRTVQ